MKLTKSGFTLVEMMVVIIVVGILAGLVTIGYQSATERPNDNSLRNDLTHTAEEVSLWLLDHSMEELNSIYMAHGSSGTSAAWIVGEEADNELSNTQIRWNDVAQLPKIYVGPKVTIEVVGRYTSGPTAVADEANTWMTSENMFCITGATKDGTYNYRPMSGIQKDYHKLLFYDSALERVVTMEELDEADKAGQQVTCLVHLDRWRNATGA